MAGAFFAAPATVPPEKVNSAVIAAAMNVDLNRKGCSRRRGTTRHCRIHRAVRYGEIPNRHQTCDSRAFRNFPIVRVEVIALRWQFTNM